MKVFLLLLVFCSPQWLLSSDFDVIVYGGTSAGVMAAIQSARMGKSTLLISPQEHLGGMTSNGISCIDARNANLIGGLAHDFFHRVWLHYINPENWLWEKPRFIKNQVQQKPAFIDTMWLLEPHVAEKIFNSMLSEFSVVLVKGERLERKTGVFKKGQSIVKIAMESGKVFSGKVFLDATYEGDLMATAGVSYLVGRESNSLYNEKNNGVQPVPNKFFPIDPYVIPGDKSSGLLPRVFPNIGGKIGEADNKVQAYTYRLCLTNIESNYIPIEKPENYDELEYEILFRAVDSVENKTNFLKLNSLPNKKFDVNNIGPISTDYVGMSWCYPEADYALREQIAQAHKDWLNGLLWTLQNHPRIPKKVRNYYTALGLAKDEFVDNEHWPYEIYIREARRMISDMVITEHVATGSETWPNDPIGMAAYHLDSHAVKYYVNAKGQLKTEGGIYRKVPPFPVSYRAIVPKYNECQNLLVPVCLSASHVAYGAIRMEPIFMILAQSAAAAACLAIDLGCAVQDVPYELLREQLLKYDQVIQLR